MQITFKLEFLPFNNDIDIISSSLLRNKRESNFLKAPKLISNLCAFGKRSWASTRLSNSQSFATILLTCPNFVKIVDNSKHLPPRSTVNDGIAARARQRERTTSHSHQEQSHTILVSTRDFKHSKSNFNRRFSQVFPIYIISCFESCRTAEQSQL